MRTKAQEFRRCKPCEDKTGNNLCGACINNQSLISQLEGDEKRLDFLQSLLHRKKCILRMSDNDRGFRLHQTMREGGEYSVRLAIDNYRRETMKSIDTSSYLQNPVVFLNHDLENPVGKCLRITDDLSEVEVLLVNSKTPHLINAEIGYAEGPNGEKQLLEISISREDYDSILRLKSAGMPPFTEGV